jgi:hypothetical protein
MWSSLSVLAPTEALEQSMTMLYRAWIAVAVGLAFWLGLSSVAHAQDIQRVAVLELSGSSVSGEVRLQLSDALREGVITEVRGQGVGVMTRENMAVVMRDMGLDPTCVEAECEVETGRNIGARFVVSGAVTQVESAYVMTIKVHDTVSALVLDSRTTQASQQLALVDQARQLGRAVSAVILREASSQVEEGSVGQGGDWGVSAGNQGVVRFVSTPPGATVFVDGQLQCKTTPCDAELPQGEHSVELQLARHHSARSSFSVATGQMKTISEPLKPKFGVIRFTSTPRATVVLDGRQVCRQTPCEVRVDPGMHEVQMQASDFHPDAQAFSVTEDVNQTVFLELEPAFATLDVRATNGKARIRINGSATQVPSGARRMSPGRVEVILDEPCSKAEPVILELKEGDAQRVTLQVEPRMVDLDVEVGERSGGLAPGHFMLDGQRWGNNPQRAPVSACAKTLTFVQYGEQVWSTGLSGQLREGRSNTLRPMVAQNTLWKKWKRKNEEVSDGRYYGFGIPVLPSPGLGPGNAVEFAQSLSGSRVRRGVRLSLTGGVIILDANTMPVIVGGLGELFLQHSYSGEGKLGFCRELNIGLARVSGEASGFGPTFGVGWGLGWTGVPPPLDLVLHLRYATMSGLCPSKLFNWLGSKPTCSGPFTNAPAILADLTFTRRTDATIAVGF